MRMAATCMQAAQSGVRAAGDGAANARRAGATVCARAVCISECYSEQRTADARMLQRSLRSCCCERFFADTDVARKKGCSPATSVYQAI